MALTVGQIQELKELRPDLVSELSVARARKKDAVDLEEALTLKIKQLMADEEILEYAPASSPLKLAITGTPTAKVDWKKEWQKLARDKWSTKWVKFRVRLRKKYTETVVKLELQLNSKHRV